MPYITGHGGTSVRGRSFYAKDGAGVAGLLLAFARGFRNSRLLRVTLLEGRYSTL